MVWARRPFEDLARISSYPNDVTSVWLVQMGSKMDHKLGNAYKFVLLQKFSIAHQWFGHGGRLKIWPESPPTQMM
jgi:hypothetical protein